MDVHDWVFTLLQASGDIESHFSSEVMEPQLVVFHDGAEVVQMFLSAENEALIELPSTTILNGIAHLWPNLGKPGSARDSRYARF